MNKPKEYKYCKRCGKKLKSEESRRIGYGPTCLKKRNSKWRGNLFL